MVILLKMFGFVFLMLLGIVGQSTLVDAEGIPLDRAYSYEIMVKDIELLLEQYPDIIEVHSLGRTKYGRDIWAIKLGNGTNSVFIGAALHGREWIGSITTMKMIERYTSMYAEGNFKGKAVKEILDSVSIWFVPMVNPDGVELQQNGLSSIPLELHRSLRLMNRGKSDFIGWKANSEGIDLNRQFSVGWNEKRSDSIYRPWYQFYKGAHPFQASEVRNLANFISKIDPELVVDIHSTGRVIYWSYPENNETVNLQAHDFAKKVSSLNGYRLARKATTTASGLFIDWFMVGFDRPAVLVELGKYQFERSVPVKEIPVEWERNKDIGLLAALEGIKLAEKRIVRIGDFMTLDEVVPVYQYPNDFAEVVDLVGPGVIFVEEKRGRFYRMSAEDGGFWVEVGDGLDK